MFRYIFAQKSNALQVESYFELVTSNDLYFLPTYGSGYVNWNRLRYLILN